MIDIAQVQVELSGARAARLAAEAAGSEIEALVAEMQRAWQRVALADALIDETYDPHLVKPRPH